MGGFMAFTPSTLSVILQTIGGVGMRFVSYRSDDAIATLTGTGYFASGTDYGLRLHDLIFVSPVSGSVEPYVLVVTAVDSEGNVTAEQTAFDAELTALAGLDKSDGNFIVGNGTTWVAENGLTAQASLGLNTTRIATIAAGASVDLSGWSQVIVNRYASGSPLCPALYRQVSADPGHSGAWQDSAGTWFEYVPGSAGIDVRAFGATGDGVTDDTDAVADAFTAAQALKAPIYFPAGIYLVDVFDYGRPGFTSQVPVIGDGARVTFVRKRTSDGQPLVTIGNTVGYTGPGVVRGVSFEGIAGDTPAVIKAYAPVRTHWEDVAVRDGIIGIDFHSGVTNTFSHCLIEDNQIGMKMVGDAALAFNGYANLNDLTQCIIINNTEWGVYFDTGTMLSLRGCDIEGNGTDGDSATGAIYVGPDAGNEIVAGIPQIALTLRDSWVEQNAGGAAIKLEGGVNRIDSCAITANGDATYDIHVTGGQYHLESNTHGSNMTGGVNLYEPAGQTDVYSGNTVRGCTMRDGFTVDWSKTTVEGYEGQTFNVAIGDLGIQSGLQVCLDARVASSYSRGQSWLDLSGNEQDFFRGADGTATATDPTFVGPSGSLDAYWSLDGGDYFTYDAANETWMEDLHKDNAAFAFAAWVYRGAAGSFDGICGTLSSGVFSNTGVEFGITSGDALRVFVGNGSGSSAARTATGPSVSAGAWTFVALRLDEAANTYSLIVNDSATTGAASYTSPSSGSATATMRIMSSGGTGDLWPNGSRIAAIAMWNTAVSQSDLLELYQRTRKLFGV